MPDAIAVRLADELTPTQVRVLRQAERGRVDGGSSTIEVLRRLGLVTDHWRRSAEVTPLGRDVRSVLLHRAAPEVKAV